MKKILKKSKGVYDKCQKDFEENEEAIFYIILKIATFAFVLGLLFLHLVK